MKSCSLVILAASPRRKVPCESAKHRRKQPYRKSISVAIHATESCGKQKSMEMPNAAKDWVRLEGKPLFQEQAAAWATHLTDWPYERVLALAGLETD